MEDSVSIIFATIVTVILVFLFPMLDVWERQDDLSYMTTYAKVVDLVDSVRNTGYLTSDMLERLRYEITATGNTYEIELEHRKWYAVPNGAGNYKQVYVSYYTNDIERDLENAEAGYRHIFGKGDYFSVSLKNTNKTQATTMKEFLYSTTLQTFKIGVPYGGMVRNDPTL